MGGRVLGAATPGPSGPASPELSAALHDRAATVLMYVFIVADIAILALMVFKPG